MHSALRVLSKRPSFTIIPTRGDGVGKKFRQSMSLPWAPKPVIRKKKGDVKTTKRQRQRLRASNPYNPQVSGAEKPDFLDSEQRFKILLEHYQLIRNSHRFFNKPVPQKELQEYIRRSKQFQQINHYKFLRREELKQRTIQIKERNRIAIQTLPQQYQQEISTNQSLQQLRDQFSFDQLYRPQYTAVMPREGVAPLRIMPAIDSLQDDL